jgi:linoleoyl-CoA desaturase
MVSYKFTHHAGREFSAALRSRVNEYFKSANIRQDADSRMFIKSIVAFAFYLTPLILMLTLGISQIWLLFLCWIIMGFSKAVIGTSVMHDALHGSYSKNRKVNQLLSFSAVMIGADPTVWKIQHNVLHHTYTNIEHADEDIQPRFVMRFTPHQKRRWFHRYQHIYALFFYSISTLVWVTLKDFFKSYHYRNLGHIQSGKPFRIHMFNMILRKALYHTLFLVLPILFLPVSAGWVILMFVSMHLVAGCFLSLVFQTAHVMPEMDFVESDDETIAQNWSVHQLMTTTNYAPGNRVLTWLVGSLNFQIEHHLFPNICHVHYPSLAPIVKQTAREFNIPYHEANTFGGAIGSHFELLRKLGTKD